MNQGERAGGDPRTRASSSRLFLTLFWFSGFSSLIYQVVWQRALTLYYGVEAVAMTLIVSIFMAGLGIGALLGGYYAERRANLVKMYIGLELAIGAFGAGSLALINLVGAKTAGVDYHLAAACMGILLIVPTTLMGMTLPILAKLVNSYTHDFLRTISRLYFVNTLGAAIGALVASYLLISFGGLDLAVIVAAVINAGLALALVSKLPMLKAEGCQISMAEIKHPGQAIVTWSWLYPVVFVTGFLALGYEIVWFRILDVLVKASPYTFSTMMFVYLGGIAIGGYAVSWRRVRPSVMKRQTVFALQVVISVTASLMMLAVFYLTKHPSTRILVETSFHTPLHPSFPPYQSGIGLARSLFCLTDIFFWPMVFMLIPTLFMGASFPLITNLALRDRQREGTTTGRVYAGTILGNVLGGVLTGFVLLPTLGAEQTLLLFSIIGLSFGLAVKRLGPWRLRFPIRLIGFLGLALLTWSVFPKRSELFRSIHPQVGPEYTVLSSETADGVSVMYVAGEKMYNYINGLHHGGRFYPIYTYMAAEAVKYAPALQDVLVIGYGNGSVSETIQKSPDLGGITVVEISKCSLQNMLQLNLFKRLLSDPRLELVVDDGRRYLLRSEQRYDLILTDALRTTTAYCTNIYSQEFFEIILKHLKPGGVFMVWTDELKVLPKTLTSVFAFVRQYKSLCLASNTEFQAHPALADRLMDHLNQQERAGLASYMNDYLGDQEFIKTTTAGYPINRDLRPATEFYLGLKVTGRHDVVPESAVVPGR